MFGPTELILLLLIVPFLIILPVIAIIDILRSKFEGNDAILMALIVIFLPVLGSILYFILGPAKKIR